ncbi:LysR family transcriptional regulator [Bacillus sp. OK048]|uniref:LysR family transcriptional regulator n=1 Tax=Bacillus sp. OK048 TaxID=1882761 RepID=UPI000888CFA7|nr:LysR family transcriptional regulator [Bacillus sp. OK048]SDM35459.1 DNA-binding transcriptional regulator, LysR family [Bacillus sp. OK048]
MNTEHLRYIIEVSEQGTIAKAAENLHVSHSAISQAIGNMESELGAKIFNRSRAGSQCTMEGKAVIKLSLEIMNKLAEMKTIGQEATLLKGDLKIAASAIYFSTFLPELLYSFRKNFPYVQIEMHENDTHNIIETVKSNLFDIGLVLGTDETLKMEDPRITYEVLLQSSLVVCVSKYSPLAYNTSVGPEELIRQPLVRRNEKFADRFWNKLFLDYGEGNVVFYSNNHDVIKNLIANNIATGIYSEFWIRNDPLVLNGDIVTIPYVDHDKEYSKSYLISVLPKTNHLPKVTREFLQEIKNKLK